MGPASVNRRRRQNAPMQSFLSLFFYLAEQSHYAFRMLPIIFTNLLKITNLFRYREDHFKFYLCTQLLQPHKLRSYLYSHHLYRPAALFWQSASLPIVTTRKRNCCVAFARTNRQSPPSPRFTPPCSMPGRCRRNIKLSEDVLNCGLPSKAIKSTGSSTSP